MAEDDWNHLSDSVKREFASLREKLAEAHRHMMEARARWSETARKLTEMTEDRDSARAELATKDEKIRHLYELLDQAARYAAR